MSLTGVERTVVMLDRVVVCNDRSLMELATLLVRRGPRGADPNIMGHMDVLKPIHQLPEEMSQ